MWAFTPKYHWLPSLDLLHLRIALARGVLGRTGGSDQHGINHGTCAEQQAFGSSSLKSKRIFGASLCSSAAGGTAGSSSRPASVLVNAAQRNLETPAQHVVHAERLGDRKGAAREWWRHN
jgi:hypothetical protein